MNKGADQMFIFGFLSLSMENPTNEHMIAAKKRAKVY